MRSCKEQKRQGRRFWSDASLSGLWSKGPDGGWPLVGFKGRSSQNVTRLSKSCRAVRAALQRKGKGKALYHQTGRPWVQVLPWPFFSVSSGLAPCSRLPSPLIFVQPPAVSIATPAVCMVSVKPHFGITVRLLPYLASYML